MASNNIFIYELVTHSLSIASDAFCKIKESPEDDNSYFNVDLLSQNELTGEYVLVQNVKESYYNYETRTFEARIAPKAQIISFDIIDKRLEIWGNKASANRLIFFLSQILANTSINLVEFSLPDIIKRSQLYKVKICKVCFENFLFTEDIVGNFTVDLSTYGDAYSVIRKFYDRISKLTISLPHKDTSIKVCLSAKGSVTVFKNRKLLDDDAVTLLHDLLIKGGE